MSINLSKKKFLSMFLVCAFLVATLFCLTGCGACKHETLNEDSIQCIECDKYIIDGVAYDLTECEYNTYTGTSMPTYADPKVELKKGKNLLQFNLLDDGEDEWTLWENCGFYVAVYTDKSALNVGNWDYLANVDRISLYDYKGNKIDVEGDDTVGHVNAYGTASEATYYNHEAYVLIEVSEDMTVYVYFGDC